MTPFQENLGYTPSFMPIPSGTFRSPLAGEYIIKIQEIQNKLKRNLSNAIDNYKRFADKHRREERVINIGDYVLLQTKNLPIKWHSQKLGPRFIGPFLVTENIGKVAFKLKLPQGYKIHNVFHVNLLKPVNPNLQYENPQPTPIFIDGTPEYHVKEILAHKIRYNKTHYQVLWEGYPIEESTWEPASNLTNCQEVLSLYIQAHPELGSGGG